ncbi:MAG TPA: class I SAM-dependent methyltransferase [Gemmatimonadales bacterium]|nr:class I SAM-dependent methyltransferase [Gemmatimonadales bacterium]
MADYRTTLFDAYVSTHTGPRKGELTIRKLEGRSREWEAQLAEFLPSDLGARILDAGCGDGAVLWWLQRRGYSNAEGVEVSAEQVAIAESVGVNNVHLGHLRDFLADRAEVYTLLVLRNVLEHFRKDEVIELLRLCHRALRPAGHILVQVPNAESPFFGRIRYGDFTHELAFTTSSLAQVFAATGFDEHRFRPVRPIFRGRLRGLRALAWRAVEQGYRALIAAEAGVKPAVVTLDILAHARKV